MDRAKAANVISHLAIIHTWASFAHEHGILLEMPEICSIEQWTMEALELLKEKDDKGQTDELKRICRVLFNRCEAVGSANGALCPLCGIRNECRKMTGDEDAGST